MNAAFAESTQDSSNSVTSITSAACDLVSAKWVRLQRVLAEMSNAVVAFSGGVDSTFVLKAAAVTLGASRVVAFTGLGPSVPQAELDDAARLAQLIGVEHVVMETAEVNDPRYNANPTIRCYFCKAILYAKLREFAKQRAFSHILNGTNKDDLGDYRPGLQAAREFGIDSPAVDADLSKKEIRELSRRLGLPTFDKPAGPCLASRIQYGESITVEKLNMVEKAEQLLHELGIRECRVRHHGKIARIEIAPEYFPLLTNPETAALIDGRFRARL